MVSIGFDYNGRMPSILGPTMLNTLTSEHGISLLLRLLLHVYGQGSVLCCIITHWMEVLDWYLSPVQEELIHVNPERTFRGTNGEPPSEASQLQNGGSGVLPGIFKKPILQMVQSQLFLSYICEYN